MPSLNGPAGDTWNVRCRAAEAGEDGGIDRRDTALFSFRAELDGLAPVPANNTPITGYGTDPAASRSSAR